MTVVRLFWVHEMDDTKDKTEEAFRLLKEWKEKRRKGEIVLMLDGSGNVAKVKVAYYIS
jgi:hypothetical protein